MAQNKQLSVPPIPMTATTTTTIIYPGGGAVQTVTGYISPPQYVLIKHMRAVNQSGTAATISLYKGATGAAVNSVAWGATSVPANSSIDWYGSLRLDGNSTGDYLTGGASSVNAIYLEVDMEVGLI